MLLADTVPLDRVIERLRATRSLFHSEADLQHSFAVAVSKLDDALRVRLEVPFRDGRSTYLDVLVTNPVTGLSTAVELKYSTARLEVTDPLADEQFRLRSHAADDLVRWGVVKDVERLERWASPQRDGVSLLLTDVRSLWSKPADESTRDRAFRLHQGRRLSGDLVWGDGDDQPSDVLLAGSYTAD